ncbi:hypothetical protein [Bordetella genomosp. 1]|uniref:Uncharacterized protein n=1 Tax=Bordetella genomosp. 1 TaxID=1395607 RepID=A0ABX4F3F2_9BORD|nr:hypothetical protein [Bordetella genomosp. 1]OZI68275.1 hypothetical protein CAL27_02035 [Bordetella genomosp. 1]
MTDLFPTVHVVHCIDTEGPLDESLADTFVRLRQLFGIDVTPTRENLERLQRQEIPLDGLEADVAKVVSPSLMAYNRTWHDIHVMLDDCMSPGFRNQMVDDDGRGWVYSWHCMDHLGLNENPRRKDFGYGNIFRFYTDKIAETNSVHDEIDWHFHPLSLTRHPLHAATSFANTMDVLMPTIARRIIDNRWFPTTNRPGFHAERPDSHLFFEQWIPFDYANQAHADAVSAQRDTQAGRFGDWSRAPADWLGYNPSHDDYQQPGACRRWIFRCLNLGTRLRVMQLEHVREAFRQARDHGSAILAFADHDYRDIRPDVQTLRTMLQQVRAEFPDVKLRFSGAHEAAAAHVTRDTAAPPPLKLSLEVGPDRLHVKVLEGAVFGPQPFLALRTRDGRYYHDNFDVITPNQAWTYVLDDQTLPLQSLSHIGVGAAGRFGGFHTVVHHVG